ncbi:MAG: hypothetical protein PF569_08185 [Candidatus Woesearchaeota archaeon]|jgi:hypothetical protein|nr:hypothetical protein [Candidatus Woesearchaeota archaeon]
MALPLTIGSNPADITISHSQWVKTHSSVNVGIVKNRNAEEQEVYLTYLVAGSTAPPTLEGQPIWKVHTPAVKVSDGVTLRDIYVWTVKTDAEITVEA